MLFFYMALFFLQYRSTVFSTSFNPYKRAFINPIAGIFIQNLSKEIFDQLHDLCYSSLRARGIVIFRLLTVSTTLFLMSVKHKSSKLLRLIADDEWKSIEH